MKKIIGLSLVFLIIDQLSKLMIVSFLDINKTVSLIGNFFSLTHVRNYGAAFSILEGNRYFLVLVGIGTLILIYNLFIKNVNLSKLETLSLSILIGGILGNLIDRIMYGYVVDFFDFKIGNSNFPIFNMADIFIVVSMFFIVVTMLGEKNEKDSNRK